MACANLGKLSREELKSVLGSDDLVEKLLAAGASAGRANHAGVPSNVPPANPSRRVDILDVEDVVSKVMPVPPLQDLYGPPPQTSSSHPL